MESTKTNKVKKHRTLQKKVIFITPNQTWLNHCVLSPLFRLIRNPLGSTHPEATLKACLEHGAPEDAVQAAKAEFHAQLASKRGQQANGSADLVEDSELLSEDRELDSDNQGNS